MNDVVRRLVAGDLRPEEAEAELKLIQLDELGKQARLDVGREARRGIPEVVFGMGKSPQQVARLVVALAEERGQGLGSRLTSEHWAALEQQAAGFEVRRYDAAVRVLRLDFRPTPRAGRVAVLTAGTSDLRVAEEARMMTEACGLECRIESDIGVAGLHRLFAPLRAILAWDPDVIIVAAGMDGVLPGVVTGLVDLPVIGVPVSTGYGAGGQGHAALLTMLQSCATGLLTVNIDNGIGAAAAAVLIASRVASARSERENASAPAVG